jgi:aminoglycoside phosphotransferase family enzyme
MERSEIEIIVQQGNHPDSSDQPSIRETHISWLIIGQKYAFKIKKPLNLSFLDFSTLKARKYYCEQELRLNKRLEPEMYLNVLPIKKKESSIGIGDDYEGKVIDYAVQMQKKDPDLLMPELLRQHKVTTEDIKRIAHKVAKFHHQTKTVYKDFSLEQHQENFADIKSVYSVLVELTDRPTAQLIPESIDTINQFLNEHQQCFQDRVANEMIKDGHGDLHSGNIFLYDPPVIFDCIEFNNDFRQIDMLNEIAFFCMDMEAYGAERFSQLFKDTYLAKNPAIRSKAEAQIFKYYKCYRANVRLKVNLIQYSEEKNPSKKQWIKKIQPYLELMEKYTQLLQPTNKST